MKNLSSIFLLTIFLVSFSLTSHAMKPGDKLQPAKPIVSLTQGFELIPLQLNLGLDGKISFIEAKACESCELVRYKIDANTKFSLAGRSITQEEAISLSYHFADIIYEPKERLLLDVSFHIMEKAL